jgi:MoxR-like ATPase
MSARDQILTLKQGMARAIIGQEQVVERLLLTLLANGNLLLEGLPGLAKTRAIKSLAQYLESEFRRIQFTPDLLPSDVTGTEVYYDEGGKGSFRFQPGPIFVNLILADEINRAPAKVQAALLEAMEERQVTVAGTTHPLPALFMVLATQNPIEQEGTYPLPEAQMDRFLLHVVNPLPRRRCRTRGHAPGAQRGRRGAGGSKSRHGHATAGRFRGSSRDPEGGHGRDRGALHCGPDQRYTTTGAVW